MQGRARKLSFGWRAVKPAVLLLVVGAFSLGLQACGSDSSTSTPVVKKEAGGSSTTASSCR